MTDEIRERTRALLHASHLDAILPEKDYERLEQGVSTLLASERAAALGAAADVVTTCRRCGCSLIAEGLPCCENPCTDEDTPDGPLDDAIRSLSPAGWVGMRAEDLAVVKEAAEAALIIFEGSVTGVDDAEVSALRAALARMA